MRSLGLSTLSALFAIGMACVMGCARGEPVAVAPAGPVFDEEPALLVAPDEAANAAPRIKETIVIGGTGESYDLESARPVAIDARVTPAPQQPTIRPRYGYGRGVRTFHSAPGAAPAIAANWTAPPSYGPRAAR